MEDALPPVPAPAASPCLSRVPVGSPGCRWSSSIAPHTIMLPSPPPVPAPCQPEPWPRCPSLAGAFPQIFGPIPARRSICRRAAIPANKEPPCSCELTSCGGGDALGDAVSSERLSTGTSRAELPSLHPLELRDAGSLLAPALWSSTLSQALLSFLLLLLLPCSSFGTHLMSLDLSSPALKVQ